jgi:hypothetical protein
MKLLFILFPGFGVSKKGWDTWIERDGTKRKTNFIKELKKLGEIYYHEPLYHNINWYDKRGLKYKSLYSKNINFTKKDFDVEYTCGKIYDDVKNFDGKYVLIGHSIGLYFVYCFEQKYSSKVLFTVNIDGTPLGPIEQTLNDKKDLYTKIIKYTGYTDERIEELKEKTLSGNSHSIDELFDTALYNILDYKKIQTKHKNLKNR